MDSGPLTVTLTPKRDNPLLNEMYAPLRTDAHVIQR
jgi:hypothetical protein